MRNNLSAEEILTRVLRSSRAGLLTDIDGTISPIAPHPDDAFVDERARKALSKLSRQITLVGAVSGRSANDAHRLVGLENLVYSGNHGMELWRNGQLEQSSLAARFTPRITDLLNDLKITQRVPELYVEHKGLTASIHYRTVPDSERIKRELLDEVERLAARYDLRVTRGRMVVEIRPPVDLSKGTSVLELLDEYRLNGLVYLGDDLTDVDAFKALRERRERDCGHFYAIGVTGDQTPDEVIAHSDALADGIEGVVELLRSCAA